MMYMERAFFIVPQEQRLYCSMERLGIWPRSEFMGFAEWTAHSKWRDTLQWR